MVKLCPQGKILSLPAYQDELERAGFVVVSAEKGGGGNASFEAVIMARPKCGPL